MTEQEQELRAAFNRVERSLEGVVTTAQRVETEIAPGKIDVGMRIPLVKNRAGDVRLIAQAIPQNMRTKVCNELAFGVRSLPDELTVQQQSTCVSHLVGKARPFIPVPSAAEPTPEPEPSAEEAPHGEA